MTAEVLSAEINRRTWLKSLVQIVEVVVKLPIICCSKEKDHPKGKN